MDVLHFQWSILEEELPIWAVTLLRTVQIYMLFILTQLIVQMVVLGEMIHFVIVTLCEECILAIMSVICQAIYLQHVVNCQKYFFIQIHRHLLE